MAYQTVGPSRHPAVEWAWQACPEEGEEEPWLRRQASLAEVQRRGRVEGALWQASRYSSELEQRAVFLQAYRVSRLLCHPS